MHVVKLVGHQHSNETSLANEKEAQCHWRLGLLSVNTRHHQASGYNRTNLTYLAASHTACE